MADIKKKKILYLITKSNYGGAQRYVFDLATNLNPEEFEVVVALGGTGRLVDELKNKKIRTITPKNLERDISIFKEFKLVVELWKIIKSEKPDILHINSSKAGGLGAFIGRILGVPKIIFTAHGWAFNEDRPWWQRIIIKKLHWITVVLSHTTIAVSEMTKRQMNWPFVQNKMVVIHNGRTTQNLYSRDFARSFFTQYMPDLEEYKDDFWSVSVGELHPVKQHDVTIRALKNVVEKNPNIRHIIIGDGDEQKKLERLVLDLDLEDNVFFAGHILEVSQYLKAFDLFILSSRSEALAYVIIEACIAGLPIIASNVGGIPEILTHEKDGLLVNQGDASTLTKYYNELLENPDQRKTLAENAHLRAQDFTFEKMFEKTLVQYQ